jgi:tetratricopeptide (TPR) repeat protein
VHKKNNLFDLIKSLSLSEKRYFRRSLSGNGKDDSNFLLLFDEIDKMDSYSESEIKNTFKGKKFVNQLHVTKIYLQDTILKSLRSFHAASSSSMLIKDLLKNIEICLNKELYNQCVLEIQKAEKTANQMEDDIAMLEILNWKRKLAQIKSPTNLNLKEIIGSQGALLQRLNNVHVLWELMAGISGPKLPDKESAHSLNEKVLLHHLIYRIEIQHGRNNEAKKSLEELIGILENNPLRLKEEPGLYLASVNNLLSFLVFTKDYDQALALLSKAKVFYESSDKAKRNQSNFRQILRMYNIELEIYRDTESLEKGISLISNIEKLIKEHNETTPKEYLISLWFQFGYIFFLKKDFKSSLHWINEIMNSSFARLRSDLHVQTHFLNLMVHFELKNFFVMRYFVDSTKRFGKKNQSFKPHHKVLLAFFTKISGAPEVEYRMLFGKLYNEIVAANLIPPHDLDYINWNKWIAAKAKRS